MTFHAVHVGILLWVFVLGWRLIASVRRGALRYGKVDYTSAGQPVEYWFGLLFETALLLALLWYGYDRATGGEGPRISPFLLLLVGYSLFRLIRCLQAGSTGLGNMTADRREQPGRFWGMLTAQLALTAGVFWLALWLGGPKRDSEVQETYAVADAVRERVPQARNAAFAKVRMDGKSGFVCGEFSRKDSRQRFFGTVAQGEATAIVEGEGMADFESRYRELCGGTWVLPRPS